MPDWLLKFYLRDSLAQAEEAACRERMPGCAASGAAVPGEGGLSELRWLGAGAWQQDGAETEFSDRTRQSSTQVCVRCQQVVAKQAALETLAWLQGVQDKAQASLALA